MSNVEKYKALNIKKHIFWILIMVFSHQIGAQSSFEAQVDSLQNVLSETRKPRQKVDVLNTISYTYRRIEPEKVIEYALQAQQLAAQHQYTKGEAIAFKNIGIGHYKLGSSRDTIVGFFQKATEKAKEVGDIYTEIACLNNIALVYSFSLEFYTGIQYLLQAIDLYDKHYQKDNQLKGTMVANVGFSYFSLEDYPKALTYFERAIQIANDNNIPALRSIYLDDLGRTYLKLNRFDEAESTLNQALEEQSKMGDYQSTIQTLQYKIELSLKRNKYNEALSHGLKALEMPQIQDFSTLLSGTLNRLMEVSILAEDYEKAIEYGEKSIEITRKSDLLAFEKEALSYLFIAYNKQGLFAKAYQASSRYISLTDSLQNSEKEKYTANLEAKYQNNERNQRIEFLNQEQKNQQIRIQLLIGLIVLTLLSIGIISFLYFKRQQSSTIIAEKNLKLNEYIKYNMELENFAHIASHDLKSPLRTIVSYSQLLQRKSNYKLDETEKEYLDYVITGTKEMSLLVDDLLSYSQIQSKAIAIETIDPIVLINDVLRLIHTLVEEKKADIQLNLEPKTIKGDPTKLKQLLQNLISNAIKFHKPNEIPIVKINLTDDDRYWKFEIQDNGIGIEQEYYDKVFLIFKRLQGKERYEGTGIGLAICKKIADQHNGNIWVNSEVGKGSTFTVTIDKRLSNHTL